MDIVEEMRGFEIDHGPDGWPGVRMRQVSALCDEIEQLRAENARLVNVISEHVAVRVEQSAEIAECKRDAKKFRWLCDVGNVAALAIRQKSLDAAMGATE